MADTHPVDTQLEDAARELHTELRGAEVERQDLLMLAIKALADNDLASAEAYIEDIRKLDIKIGGLELDASML